MRISLPYSRHKRYLTGIDWTVNAFHAITAQATGTGNFSQVDLDLDGELQEAPVRERLANFLAGHSVIHGRPARDWNLCPYWSFPAAGRLPQPVLLDVTRLPPTADADEVTAVLARAVNRPFPSEREHLAFHIVNLGSCRSLFAMTFDHRLFDARGAETFLGLLERTADGRSGAGEVHAPNLIEPAHLCDWQKTFAAGKRVTRALLPLRQADIRTLPLPARLSGRDYRFELLACDEATSRKVVAVACREAGPMMLMPYALSVATEALHTVFEGRGGTGAEYVIPVSLDSRPPQSQAEELFFNHLSFLFIRARAAEIADRKRLVTSMVQQFYDQVKAGLPQDLALATRLMRIVPLALLRPLVKLPLNGCLGSFCFAYVGKSAYALPEFMGLPVRNLFHMPRVPVLPGFGVFFTQFGARLNVTLSWLDGIFSAGEIRQVTDVLKVRLGLRAAGE